MSGRRKQHRYNSVVTGDCGHAVSGWPLIHEGGKDWVICDICVAKVGIRVPDVQQTLFDDPE